LALAQEWSKVVVADIFLEETQKVAEEVKSSEQDSLAMKVDVANKHEVQAMVNQVLEKFQRIDILINCAGILRLVLRRYLPGL